MTEEKVVTKIRKLLALAKSDNVAEAANAAAAAQRLMERHAISAAVLDSSTENRFDIRNHDTPVDSGKRLAVWKIQLLQHIAFVNGCEVYMLEEGPVTDLCLVGATEDAEHVTRLYRYLAADVNQLAERFEGGRTARASFRRGAVDTIHWRLREARDDARAQARKEAADSTALAVIETAVAKLDARRDAARRFLWEGMGAEQAAPRTETRDWDAYRAGVQAGESVDLAPGRRLED